MNADAPGPLHREDTSLSDLTLFDLFRSEMETLGAALTNGLLDLEDDAADARALETLARTAHSIKGGAKIAELEDAVRLAHAMEDVFKAVEEGRIALTPSDIDRLLVAADLLVRMAEHAGEGGVSAISPDEVEERIAAVAAIADPDSDRSVPEDSPDEAPAVAVPSKPEPPPDPDPDPDRSIPEDPPDEAPAVAVPPKPEPPPDPPDPDPAPERTLPENSPDDAPAPALADSPKPESPTAAGEGERTVRVTAAKIERLMGLAGEVVVGSRWLPPFCGALFAVKRGQTELAGTLEELQKVLETGEIHRAAKLAFEARERLKGLGRDLGERMGELDMFTSVSANLSDRLYHEVIGVRMSPFAEGIRGYRRRARDLARELGKRVRLEVAGASTEVDRDILERIAAPLNHLLRNAVDHGIEMPAERRAAGKDETGNIRLEASHRAGMLVLTVADDGRGVDPEAIRRRLRERGVPGAESADRMGEPELLDYLFQPGFSTAPEVTRISGRGVGLNVVQSTVHDVGGMVRVASRPGRGTRFQMELPLALSVVRTFLVEIAGEPYAFPLARIDRCLRLAEAEIEIVEDRQYFAASGRNVSLVNVHEVLEIADPPPLVAPVNVVVVGDRDHAYGLAVDRFLGEFDLVVRPLDPRLGKVPDISAAAVMLDGSPVLIFDVEDLIHSIDNLLSGNRRLRKISPAEKAEEEKAPPRILVVEDSFIVREKERKLLENRGYRVEVAVDGMDGWNRVRTASFDLVVSDVDMPRMNGFDLIRNIRRHPELSRVPVIVVSYKFTETDRLEGLEAGADFYLSKTDFDDDTLIDAVVDLIGEP